MEQSKFYQIKNVTEFEYTLVGCDGSVITHPIQEVDKIASAFTIQDAKDGNVLHSPSHRIIWIYKDNEHYYGCVNMNYVTENISTNGQIVIPNDTCPATKDEQTILFVKMKEAGYEWDAEKKELEKIESFDKFEGLTDFERTLADICIGWIGEELGWKEYIKDNADMLLKIAIKKFNSVQDAQFEQKSAWSEEDKNVLEDIEEAIINYWHGDTQDILLDWLKSLRPQPTWKPSELQIEALAIAIRCGIKLGTWEEEALKDLIEQLKKLK